MVSRLLATLVAAVLISGAFAIDLPEHARLTLLSSEGVVLGVGQVTNGDLSLALQSGAKGDVKLLIVGADGDVLAFDAVLTESGSVMLAQGDSWADLAEAVRASGGEAQVWFEAPARERQGTELARDDERGPATGNEPGAGNDEGARADEPAAKPPRDSEAENPNTGPNENAGDNPNKGPSENAGDNPNKGPNENAGNNPNENAGNNPNKGPNENAGNNPNKGPNENSGKGKP